MAENPKELLREAERGRSERTPWIALGGVTLAVGGFVALVVGVALILYFVI